jgi:hypothetical protein
MCRKAHVLMFCSRVALDREGRTMWIADAHRDNGKRFIVRADERLTAFAELESAIHAARLGAARHRCARLLASSSCGLIAGYIAVGRRQAYC